MGVVITVSIGMGVVQRMGILYVQMRNGWSAHRMCLDNNCTKQSLNDRV